MGHSIRTSVARLSLVVAMTLVLQASALADTPLQWWRHTDFTFRSNLASTICGFDVFVHLEGEGRATVFYDKTGAIVREVDSAPHFTVTVFAPATGKSFTWSYAGAFIQYYTDGAVVGSSVLAIVTGIDQRYPGAGVNAGRTVYEGEVIDIEDGVPIVDLVNELYESGSDLETTIAQARCDAVR